MQELTDPAMLAQQIRQLETRVTALESTARAQDDWARNALDHMSKLENKIRENEAMFKNLSDRFGGQASMLVNHDEWLDKIAKALDDFNVRIKAIETTETKNYDMTEVD